MPAGLPSLPLDALVAQRFKIEVGGVAIASFQEVSGITSEVEVVELKANDILGKPILKKMIGATKPPTITLKRAADASMELWNWHKAALDGALTGARKDGSIVIHQQILVGRDTQKAIVLGKGGARIKQIGESARKELTEAFGRNVHLFLHVKVNPKWEEDRGLYREIGLDWVE